MCRTLVINVLKRAPLPMNCRWKSFISCKNLESPGWKCVHESLLERASLSTNSNHKDIDGSLLVLLSLIFRAAERGEQRGQSDPGPQGLGCIMK